MRFGTRLLTHGLSCFSIIPHNPICVTPCRPKMGSLVMAQETFFCPKRVQIRFIIPEKNCEWKVGKFYNCWNVQKYLFHRDTRDCIHNNSFSKELMNGPNKLECYITMCWNGLPVASTLAYQYHS